MRPTLGPGLAGASRSGAAHASEVVQRCRDGARHVCLRSRLTAGRHALLTPARAQGGENTNSRQGDQKKKNRCLLIYIIVRLSEFTYAGAIRDTCKSISEASARLFSDGIMSTSIYTYHVLMGEIGCGNRTFIRNRSYPLTVFCQAPVSRHNGKMWRSDKKYHSSCTCHFDNIIALE